MAMDPSARSSLCSSIASAVSAALHQQSSDGYNFLEGVKASSETTWPAGLDIFIDNHSYAPEARMYGLQVLDDALQNHFMAMVASEQVVAVQDALLGHVQRNFKDGDAEGGLTYLRNKLVHTLFLLFMQTYTSTWPSFFTSFIDLLPASSPSSSSSSPGYNPRTTDLLLRLLHEISVEVSDTTLRLNKAHSRLVRDTELRDAVRAKDAAAIADQVGKILAFALQKMQQGTSSSSSTTSPNEISQRQAGELASMAIGVMADYAPWIDISLVVTPTHLPLVFSCLSSSHHSIRLGAAELLHELVTKGMPPSDKLELIRLLNIESTITSLLDAHDQKKAAAKAANGANGNADDEEEVVDEDDELFREKLAKVANGMGVELSKIMDESSATDAQKEAAHSGVLSLRPLALRFLSDEYDDTALSIIPFLQSLLSLYKKEKKRNASSHLSDEKTSFLRALLQTTIQKMRFSSEEEWGGDSLESQNNTNNNTNGIMEGSNDDEEFLHFLEVRRNLRTLFDAIAWIDWNIFTETVKGLIVMTLQSGNENLQNLRWMDAEVALYVLYILGEAAAKEKATIGPAAFLDIPIEEVRKASRTPDYKLDYSSYSPSTLGELMLATLQSNIVSYPHPSVPLQFFECVSRYHDFFQLAPETIGKVLPAFLDERGMHQRKQGIRSRCFYLFNRFIHTARPQLSGHLSAEAVTDICTRVQDLLIIESSLPPPETPGEDVLTKAASKGSPFDSQLYLFDALGSLISLLPTSSAAEQVSLLRALLEPLLREISAIGNNTAPTASIAPEQLFRLHHLIKAAGNIAYGFPELKSTTATPEGQWVQVFQEATKVILDALKAKSQVAIIREASLGAFKSVAARIGAAALPLVGPLIDCLVDHLTAKEIIEFLPFIGMLTHRYKTAFAEMLDVLLGPVFDRTYLFLEQPVTGTDDIQQHSELRRAYFALMLSISNAGMQDVFFSARNAPRLENLLQSVPHYLSNGALLLDQKAGFQVINKLTTAWVKPLSDPQPSPLPQFKDFVYANVVKLGMELPVRTNFDYGDAQAYLVIGEVALLYKTLQSLRGDEFLSLLTNTIFPSFGVPQETVQAFITNLTQAPDGRTFKKWLAPFFQKAKANSNDKPYTVAHLLEAVPGSIR